MGLCEPRRANTKNREAIAENKSQRAAPLQPQAALDFIKERFPSRIGGDPQSRELGRPAGSDTFARALSKLTKFFTNRVASFFAVAWNAALSSGVCRNEDLRRNVRTLLYHGESENRIGPGPSRAQGAVMDGVCDRACSAYFAGCQTMNGAPKQVENVACGSVMPTSVPATLAVYPEMK